MPWRTDGLTSPQCILGILGHGISLIQYDQLEALAGGQEDSSEKVSSCRCELLSVKVQLVPLLENGPGAGKTQNLTTYNVNTSVVRCI